MTTQLSDLQTDDFDELRDAWAASGWDADYRQLERGPFRGRLLTSQIDASVIYRGHWTCGIQHRGLQPKGTMSLAVTLSHEGRGHFNGEYLGPDNHILQAEDTDFEIVGAREWDAAVFLLPKVEVARQVAELTQGDPHSLLGFQGLVTLDPKARKWLQAACVRYFAAVEECVATGREEYPLPDMARDLAELAIRCYVDAQPDPRPDPHVARCREIVRKIEDFAESCEDARLRISDVCREVGVSERALRYAFQDVTGISPAAYIKAHRLNRFHRILLAAAPSETMVKTVAYSNSFWHLGQFTRDYKDLFGETPSQTLAGSE